MFTFASVPVMYTGLLIMFAWCTIWSTVELVKSRTTEQRISNGLHLLMSVVMVLMVPRETWIPLRNTFGFPVLIGVFVASTLWFVWLAVRPVPAGQKSHRGHFVGHAIMFGAMAWHLTGMAVKMQAMMAQGKKMGEAIAPTEGIMAVAWAGLFFMTALLVMGIRDLVATLAPAQAGQAHEHGAHVHHTAGGAALPAMAEAGCREPRPAGSLMARLHSSMGAAMNLGMFWMSVGIMVPLLPWFTVFQR